MMRVRSHRDVAGRATGTSPRRASWPLLLVVLSLGGCTLGPSELLIIFAIVLLMFGATRLPQLARALGETVKSFKAGAGETDAEGQDKLESAKPTAQIEEARVEPTGDQNERAASKKSVS